MAEPQPHHLLKYIPTVPESIIHFLGPFSNTRVMGMHTGDKELMVAVLQLMFQQLSVSDIKV